MARNRQETEQKLVEATARVLAKQGFSKLGVNAIAREARLDKVLIYRYFDGLPGLMNAYAKQGDFWPSIGELTGPDTAAFNALDGRGKFKHIMRQYARGLRARPITLQILSWEMVDRNELTAFLEDVREQQGLQLTEQMMAIHPIDQELDVLALVTVFSGAINYLAARSTKIRWFNGVDLQDDSGWNRLERMIDTIIDQLIR